jgi:transposase
VKLDINADACPCCGGAIHKIGETVSEMLDYVPAQLRVLRIRRPKYGCRACGTIHQAPAPERPIAKGFASPGLLAHVLVSKYCDHRVPRTHRQRWRCGTVREMREGPSEPAIRCRLQTTASCCR